jgi:putative NADH-flavin reductase
VTAFVRTPDKLSKFGDRITTVRGNLLNTNELAQVLEGHDAVVSGFGPRYPVSKADAHLLQQFSVALTGAMRLARIRRVVIESVAFLFKNSILPPAYLLGRLFFSGIVDDASAMEDVFERSGLDWTLVRPPALTDKPYTGKYRIGVGHLPRLGLSISRADVADFIVKAVEDPSSIGRIFGIAN